MCATSAIEYCWRMTCSCLLLVTIATLCQAQSDKVRFPKDQRTNVVFPPRILRNKGSGVPTGHLRPFGKVLFCVMPFNSFYRSMLPYRAIECITDFWNVFSPACIHFDETYMKLQYMTLRCMGSLKSCLEVKIWQKFCSLQNLMDFKGTISDCPFQTSLFFSKPPGFVFLFVFFLTSVYVILPIQQLSQKQHIFGKLNNSLLLGINYYLW